MYSIAQVRSVAKLKDAVLFFVLSYPASQAQKLHRDLNCTLTSVTCRQPIALKGVQVSRWCWVCGISHWCEALPWAPGSRVYGQLPEYHTCQRVN